MFLRHILHVLIGAKLVPYAPVDVEFSQFPAHVGSIDDQFVSLTEDPTVLSLIPVGDSKSSPFKGHESIEGNPAERTQIAPYISCQGKGARSFCAFSRMALSRNSVMTSVIFAVVAVTPEGGLLVEASQVGECSAG